MPHDVRDRAATILSACGGGSISAHAPNVGIELIREHIAAYISQRDGGIEARAHNIILSNGASEIIQNVLKLFITPSCTGKPSGILVPIPEYPLYSATATEYGLRVIGYHLDEDNNWSVKIEELEKSLSAAKPDCDPRAICVINPGNPTGQVLSRNNIEDIVRFAHENRLFILVDEVYQQNIYGHGCSFNSFKKLVTEMGSPYAGIELASFHSVSKSYMGECGQKGGYGELWNMDEEVLSLLKESILVCSSTTGQVVMDCVVNPPRPGDPSYALFDEERSSVLCSLAERAKLVHERLNSIPGITCNPVQGSMYAFPRVQIPPKAIEKAKTLGQEPDYFYASQLLETEGVCVIPGCTFGQRDGTYHFRATILLQTQVINNMLDRIENFQKNFLRTYS